MERNKPPGWLADLLNYPFQGANWEQSLVLLSLAYVGIVIFVPPLAEALEMGYALQVARRVLAQGSAPALPERIDWRACFRDGLRWLGVSVLYSLPALIAFFGAAGRVWASYGLPDAAGLAAWQGLRQGWPVLAAGLLSGILLGGLGSFLSNIAALHMLARGRFSAAFAVKQWGRILRARRGAFLKGLGISIGLGLVLTLAQMIIGLPAALLIIAPAILGAFSGIYHRLVVVAYYAQVYRSAIQ